MRITRDNLNDYMEFGRMIHVDEHGNVTTGRTEHYSPESVDADLDDIPEPWSLMTGYTGQYGYNGPIMHPSEFIGGGMADAILSTTGYYVAVTVEDGTEQGAGWAVAYRED